MSGTVKDLPKLDRPRERSIRYGVESLSEIELLALLITSGYKGVNAIEIAATLLTKFNGLYNLSKVNLNELTKIKGLKKARALNLLAAFEINKRLFLKKEEQNEEVVDSNYLFNKYKHEMLSTNQEKLVLVMLNNSRQIIHEKTLYIGTEDNLIFSYKDIWRELLNNHAKSFYLIHSHPGASSEPSYKDKIFTSEIFLESKRINIPMIDHLIIGVNGYHSFQNLKK